VFQVRFHGRGGCGWVQLYVEPNQEALDVHVQAFRLAERVSLPVMDGFILTHAVERVDVRSQAQVDAFLPPFVPRHALDPDAPLTIGAMVGPEDRIEDAETVVVAYAYAFDLDYCKGCMQECPCGAIEMCPEPI
jgi:pyruvate/2-oxoacid:ferredoxin oxidoreductase alpha subunit